MTPSNVIGITLPALILEAVKLAKDRADGVDTDAAPLFRAIRDFHQAYHGGIAQPGSTPAPTRFAVAIQAVEPGIYDPAILANALVSACAEVIGEGGFPPTDPAVRLLACQLGTVCVVIPDRTDFAEVMFECTRRTFGR